MVTGKKKESPHSRVHHWWLKLSVEYSKGEYSFQSPLLNKIQSAESATNTAVTASTSDVVTPPDVVLVIVFGVVVIVAAGIDDIVDGSDADDESINHDDFRCC